MPSQTKPQGFVRKSTFIRPEIQEKLKAYATSNFMSEYGVIDRALERFLAEVEKSPAQ